MNLKKKISLFCLALFIPFLNIKEVSAYAIPESYFYAIVNDSKLGQVKILFPKDKVEFLSLEEETQIINIGSSSFTAYSDDLSYSLSFQPFEYGRYRTSNYGDYQYLDIVSIVDTNINFYNDQGLFFDNNHFNQFMIVLIGGLLCLIWFKR